MGSSYVIDHCIAALNKERRKTTFEGYVSECLRIITENTAHLGENCSYIQVSYTDLMKPREKVPEKTADEVIAEIMADLGEKEVETNESV